MRVVGITSVERFLVVFLGLTLCASLVAKTLDTQSKRLFVVIVNDKRGYMDRNGNIVIEPQFTGASEFSEGLAAVSPGSLEGYINESGEIVIKPLFDKALPFSEGVAAVGFNQGGGIHATYKWGYIDRAGKYIVEPKYSIADDFSEGLAVVKEPRGPYSFIDRNGRTAFSRTYRYASSFSEGLACVMVNGKYGFIDRSGKVVIKPQFSYPGNFHEGLAAVVVGGKVWEPKRGQDIDSLGGTYVYIDKTGTPIIKLTADVDYAGNFSEGLARVGVRGKNDSTHKGYIDRTGKFAIEPRFSTAEDFNDGLAFVILNPNFGFPFEGFGFIDRTGKVVLSFKYPSEYSLVNGFSGGLAWVQVGGPDYRNERFGYIDKSGKIIWNPSR